jgi:hypothetical protein
MIYLEDYGFVRGEMNQNGNIVFKETKKANRGSK